MAAGSELDLQGSVGDLNGVSLQSLGGGTVRLSGNSTNLTFLSISDSTLVVEGTVSSTTSGQVSIGSNGILAGTGTLDVGTGGNGFQVQGGSIIAPGQPGEVGTLTLGSLAGPDRLTLYGNLDLDFDIGLTADRITLFGDLEPRNSNGLNRINIADAGGVVPGTYTLISYSGSLIPTHCRDLGTSRSKPFPTGGPARWSTIWPGTLSTCSSPPCRNRTNTRSASLHCSL